MNQTSALTAPRLLNSEQQKTKDQLFEAGNEAFDAEAYQAAFECYHKASLLDPSDPEVWNSLGLTYANLDYPREAWRSYRIALLADPESLNALWYGAEFLFNQEDFELCRVLLQRYLQLEEDAEARDEAEQLLQEVTHLVGEDPPALKPRASDDDSDDDPGDGDAELPAGFGSEEADEPVSAKDDDDFEDDEPVEVDLPDAGAFYASVELRLGDLSHKCPHCSAALPWDAPYCYACNAPCFYSEGTVES